MRFFTQKSGFFFQALKLETFFSGLVYDSPFFFLGSYCSFICGTSNCITIIPVEGAEAVGVGGIIAVMSLTGALGATAGVTAGVTASVAARLVVEVFVMVESLRAIC